MKSTTSRFIVRLYDDRRGATAIEYGLIVGLIAVVLITAISLVGTDIGNTLNSAANSLTN
jgi:pilus assembly protein Flp/PilA